MPSTFNKIDYVMITVSNMARSVAFYKDKLGIPMKFGTPEWTEFQTGTTTLALHGGGQAREAAADPNAHYAGTGSLGFNVDNLDLVYEQLQAKGVVFVTPPTARAGDGIRLAVAVDPDGFPISFGEAAKK
ncbi:MAG TPA: VOC family protein [Terriglobia bacterium]|nr:VOC family protein [Terriglobia bacterium]